MQVVGEISRNGRDMWKLQERRVEVTGEVRRSYRRDMYTFQGSLAKT